MLSASIALRPTLYIRASSLDWNKSIQNRFTDYKTDCNINDVSNWNGPSSECHMCTSQTDIATNL